MPILDEDISPSALLERAWTVGLRLGSTSKTFLGHVKKSGSCQKRNKHSNKERHTEKIVQPTNSRTDKILRRQTTRPSSTSSAVDLHEPHTAVQDADEEQWHRQCNNKAEDD